MRRNVHGWPVRAMFGLNQTVQRCDFFHDRWVIFLGKNKKYPKNGIFTALYAYILLGLLHLRAFRRFAVNVFF